MASLRSGLWILAGFITASCGGGGGGGSTPVPSSTPPTTYSLSFNPNPLIGTVAVGYAHIATVTATIDKAIASKVNIAIVDKVGVLQPGVAPVITANSSLSYTVQLTTANTLTKGKHSGNIEVRICSDDPAVCNQPINGSPWQLPYQLTVQDGLVGTTLPVSGIAPPPTATGGPSLESCLSIPSNLVNTFNNDDGNSGNPSRIEWQNGLSFEGQTGLTGITTYNALGKQLYTLYAYFDSMNQKVNTVGVDAFDTTTGAKSAIIKLINYSQSTSLAVGSSEVINYTIRYVLPTGIADQTAQRTITYLGNENVSVVGADPNQPLLTVPTCKLKYSTPGLQESIIYASPGLGTVKHYATVLELASSDLNRTQLTELRSTTAVLPNATAPQFTAAPTLQECSKLPAGLNQTFTQQVPGSSSRRATSVSIFDGVSSVSQKRTNNQGLLSSEHFFDAAVGHLKRIGYKLYDAVGTLVSTTSLSSANDVTTTVVGQSMNVMTTASTSSPGNATPTITTQTSVFSNLGSEAVITPAGTFNACKVRITSSSNEEIDHFVPNHGWVKSTIRPIVGGVVSSTLTTYELVAEQ
jgi:hypothetical protein